MTDAEKIEYLHGAMLEAYGLLYFTKDGEPQTDEAAMILRVALDTAFYKKEAVND